MAHSPEFLELIEQHRGILIRVSRIYFSDEEDQDELIQEIVFQLWRSFDTYNRKSKFSTWMYRVALNTAITYFKKNKKRPITNYDPQVADLRNGRSENNNGQLDYFNVALQSLSSIERALIFMHLEGFSHNHVADQLGISEGNARVRLNRTKNKIKSLIREMGYEF